MDFRHLQVTTDGSLAAYDALGATNCSGSPTTCLPLWRTPVRTTGGHVFVSSPAVANGVVYFVATDYHVNAVDATGTAGCAGTPRICLPLWSAAPGGVTFGSPVIVKGTLYVDTAFDRTVRAYAIAKSG